MRGAGVEELDLEPLVARAVGGDEAAWRELWTAIEPWLSEQVRRPRFLGPLGDRDDAWRDILVELMAKLQDDRFHRLRAYLDARSRSPTLRFRAWLSVVARRVAIDYLRAQPEYLDRRRQVGTGSAPGEWVRPGTLPSNSRLPGARPPITNLGTAAQLLRYARVEMPEPQSRALQLWIQSSSYEDIARELELAAGDDAERLVRAALERLRRAFRTVTSRS